MRVKLTPVVENNVLIELKKVICDLWGGKLAYIEICHCLRAIKFKVKEENDEK